MVEVAGDTERLRPHIKTHKLPQIVDMQMESGIKKFKCATIAEAEMLAAQKAPDILLAMQPVGPNIDRLIALTKKFTTSKFSCLVDNMEMAEIFLEKAKAAKITLPVWIDINNGMNRTGILPGEEAINLYKFVHDSTNLRILGLHVYDGHIRISDFAERKKKCDHDFQLVLDMVSDMEKEGLSKPKIIAGGTPTFPIHAQRKDVDLSPGTILLWDEGYGGMFPDMDFLYSAVLLSRIVSKPSKNTICLDLGHKAIASEMTAPRILFLNLEHSEMFMHSEEHMALKVDNTDYHVGDIIYGVPRHICPTVDRYDSVFVVEDHHVVDEWQVVSRKRKLTV